MIQQVFNAAQLVALPADKTIDVRDTGRTQKHLFFRLINMSPYLFQLLDDRGVIREVCFPWDDTTFHIEQASDINGVVVHALTQLGTVPDVGAQQVLYELASMQPIPHNPTQPPFIEINGANKSALLTVVTVTFAATVQIDTGLASRKSVRVTSSASNANKIALGYLNTLTAADPPAAATDGVILPPGNSMTFGVGPSIKLFGRAMVADTKVTVEELA